MFRTEILTEPLNVAVFYDKTEQQKCAMATLINVQIWFEIMYKYD